MSDDSGGRLARYKRPLCYVMGTFYVVAGLMHFVVPDTYAGVIPPQFPRPLALAYFSGVAEVLLGVGVLVRQTRRYAAWGLIALLLAIFPANVYMATEGIVVDAAPDGMESLARVGAWARLPLQGLLIAWAWWYTDPTLDPGA